MKTLRIKVPFVADILFVMDAALIRRIEASGAVDRIHRFPTAKLPAWVRAFFRATKFHDAERDLWFCPLESETDPSYRPRRRYLEDKVATGYSADDVRQIADLLTADAPDDHLAHAMVQIVNQRFFGAEIPAEISRAAHDTVQNLGEAIVPWKYRRGRRAQQRIMDYCAHALPADVHHLDVGHNIGEVVQTTAGALKRLKANLDKPIDTIFTAEGLTPQVLRIATMSSTFDGALKTPVTAGWTIIVFKIGRAAADTGSLMFTFGTGGPDRLCVFKDFFLAFMADLQRNLLERRASAAVPPPQLAGR